MTGPDDLARLAARIREGLGIRIDDGDVLSRVLNVALRRARLSSTDELLARLASPAELAILAESLTVAETYFFRAPAQLAAFAEVVVPELLRARAERRELRVLSAGCSTGDEPYTLAILLREHVPDLASWRVTIAGLDVNHQLLARARRGRTTRWALRQTPAPIVERWFRPDAGEFVLDDAIRSMVTFEQANLNTDDRWLAPAAWDVVFFRNVSIYFSPAATRAAIDRLARTLSPGGCLFLGESETLRGVSERFKLRCAREAFFYELGDDRAAPAPAPPPDGAWDGAIRRSTERARGLGAAPAATPAPAPLTPTVAAITELVRRDRFEQALAALRALPEASRDDAEALLLLAVVLTNQGDVSQAEAACNRLLAKNDLDADAHYLKALCLERNGDPRAAAEHDKRAIYLDPAFAMPHLHVGLLARRRGDIEGARRSMARALELLPDEDARRLVLFGGGFSREALVMLCRAELRAAGGDVA